MKTVDINGFWEIKDNPLTKEGVFMYLGRQIDPDGSKWGLDADRIYWVYRSKKEISSEETLHSFEGVPFIDEHDMLGEGCSNADYKNIAGTIHNIRIKGDVMIGDFKIYSEKVKSLIRQGKKQLSLGYRAAFQKKCGMFKGKAYDFIQVGIVGNHVALVKCGRCGSDVRIYDKAIVCDSLEIPQMEINKEEMKAVIDGMDEATLAKAHEAFVEKGFIQTVEDKEPEKKDSPDKTDPEKKDEVKDGDACPGCGKTPCECKTDTKDKCEDEDKKDKVEDEKKEEKKTDPEKKDEVKDSAAVDVDAIRKDAALKFKEAMSLHDKLVPHIGEFVMDEMFTAEDVAVYGCKKLNLNVNAGSELATLTGFLAGSKAKADVVITQDAAVKKTASGFDFKAAYKAK